MHGLGLLFIIGVRLFLYWSGKRAAASGRPLPAWLARMQRSNKINPEIFGWAVRGGFLLGAFLSGLNGRPVWAISCLILGLPQLVLSALLIPAGVPYAAYYFTRVVRPMATVGETRGGAVFNEIRARLRWGLKLDRASAARLMTDLNGFVVGISDRSVRAATLTARAMLDAIEGDAEHARELFSVVQTMARSHGARSVRAYCQAWLLSDAARCSAYHDVVRLSQRGPLTRRRWFLRGAARRLLGLAGAPGPRTLVASWLLAPARRHTFSLLQAALRAPFRPQLAKVDPGLAGARAATLRLMRLPPGVATRVELRLVARAWQSVFDSGEIRELTAARGAELRASFEPATIAGRFEQEISGILAQFWRDSLADDETDAHESPLILAAKDQLQSELLGELESLCHALPRGSSRTTDDLEQHWRAWARARHLAQLFFDVLPDRRYMVFESVGGELLNHAAWLFNKEHARILAHDIFRFLLELAPKDDLNRVTIERNVRLSV